MPTLKDLSKQLGLSITTVSRALNGFPEVRESTRARVAEAALAMNYRPNQLARKLVTGSSGVVGLLLHSAHQFSFYGHFFEIVSGLSSSFLARDIDLVLNVNSEQNVRALYHRMIDRGMVDGFIVTWPEVDDPRIDLLLRRDVPFVVHGRTDGREDYAYFDIDNHGVSYQSVMLLAGLGHRRIALLNGPEHLAFARERVRGFAAAHSERNLALLARLVRHGDASEAYGAAAAAAMLAEHALAPTAIICVNTRVAAGVYAAAKAAGRVIPRDVSVIAHDDAPPRPRRTGFDPRLTVTSAPLRDAITPLADLLIRRIRGEPVEALQIVRRIDVLAGASTAPIGHWPDTGRL